MRLKFCSQKYKFACNKKIICLKILKNNSLLSGVNEYPTINQCC